MKLISALVLAVGLTCASASHAHVTPDGKGFGIGVQGGSPNAVTMKIMTTDYTGFVIGIGVPLGLYFDPAPGLSLHVDHLWHTSFVSGPSLSFNGYIGLGGEAIFTFDRYKGTPLGFGYFEGDNNLAFLARVPLGVSLAFNGFPLELYAEADPALVVFPYIGFGVGAAVGARIFF